MPTETPPDDDVRGTATYYPADRILIVRRLLAKWKGREVEHMTVYRVDKLNPNPEIGSPALRLTQADGKSYDLIRGPFGWTCECPDYLNRREGKVDTDGKPLRCKHLKAALKAIPELTSAR